MEGARDRSFGLRRWSPDFPSHPFQFLLECALARAQVGGGGHQIGISGSDFGCFPVIPPVCFNFSRLPAHRPVCTGSHGVPLVERAERNATLGPRHRGAIWDKKRRRRQAETRTGPGTRGMGSSRSSARAASSRKRIGGKAAGSAASSRRSRRGRGGSSSGRGGQGVAPQGSHAARPGRVPPPRVTGPTLLGRRAQRLRNEPPERDGGSALWGARGGGAPTGAAAGEGRAGAGGRGGAAGAAARGSGAGFSFTRKTPPRGGQGVSGSRGVGFGAKRQRIVGKCKTTRFLRGPPGVLRPVEWVDGTPRGS